MQNDPNIYMEEEMVKISHSNVEKCKQTCSTRLKKKKKLMTGAGINRLMTQK